jgi:hypothetical protein
LNHPSLKSIYFPSVSMKMPFPSAEKAEIPPAFVENSS